MITCLIVKPHIKIKLYFFKFVMQFLNLNNDENTTDDKIKLMIFRESCHINLLSSPSYCFYFINFYRKKSK